MHFSVNHRTTYRYSAPVYLEPHTLRLRPRTDGAQRPFTYDLRIDPEPAGRSEFLDPDGNAALQIWFTEPLTELSLDSSFMLETLRSNAYDFLLPRAERLALPIRYEESLETYLRGGDAAAAFAAEIVHASGMQAMPFLDALTKRIFADWRQVVRLDGDPLDAATTLLSHEGSCRDLAVLFCDACRAVGLAARFVSGYERESAVNDHPYMHAWGEVYVPGGGWRGFDPSRGVAVAADHIAVAAAAVPQNAAPIAGSYRGNARSSIDVTIQMQVSS